MKRTLLGDLAAVVAKAMPAMVLTALFCGSANAQTLNMRNLGPGIQWGTNFELSRTFNDNFFYTGFPKERVDGILFRPAATLLATSERINASLNFGGEMGRFDLPGSLGDYFDSYVGTNASYQAGVRDKFSFKASSRWGHDPFGDNRLAGLGTGGNTTLDKWRLYNLGAGYLFGAPEAALNLELKGNYEDKNYTTNEPATDFLDYKKSGLTEVVYYNVSPKTAMLLDFEQDFVRFDTNTKDDANEYRIRAGARWKATAKTQGDVRLGYVKRDFRSNAAVPAYNGFDWTGTFNWTPFRRTSLTMLAARDSGEAYASNSTFQNNEVASIELAQGITSNFKTVLTAKNIHSKYVGANRTDKTNSYGVMAVYTAFNVFDIFASLNRSERNSNVPAVEYQQTSGMVGVRIAP